LEENQEDHDKDYEHQVRLEVGQGSHGAHREAHNEEAAVNDDAEFEIGNIGREKAGDHLEDVVDKGADSWRNSFAARICLDLLINVCGEDVDRINARSLHRGGQHDADRCGHSIAWVRKRAPVSDFLFARVCFLNLSGSIQIDIV